MPQPLADKPELADHLTEVWRDFQRLGRSRPVAGMNGAPMPIPFEAMDRYWARFGTRDDRAFELWLELVQAADDAYRQVWAEKQQG